jgi:hypothetical protein
MVCDESKMTKKDAIVTKMVMISSPVPQVSKSAVSQASKPAGPHQYRKEIDMGGMMRFSNGNYYYR